MIGVNYQSMENLIKKIHKKSIIVLFIVFIILFIGTNLIIFSVKKTPIEILAIWIPRFDFSNKNDVQEIIINCKNLGFTDIFFQVRGHGTTYYNSSLEPWAYELFNENSNYLDPGWDPLYEAVQLAKANNIRIHAYINVLPGWKGIEDPPVNNGHLWINHKDYFMIDALGEIMKPTPGWYSFLNPSHPKVKDHILGIIDEIKKYNIDGIHLDYIRYPYDYKHVATDLYSTNHIDYLNFKKKFPESSFSDFLEKKSSFSFDTYTIELLKNKEQALTKNSLEEIRVNIINDLVGDISANKNILLSASVLANPINSIKYAGQDSISWIENDYIDWICQMNYSSTLFNYNLKLMFNELGKENFKNNALIGIYTSGDSQKMNSQFKMIKKFKPKGVAIFSYGLLFNKDHQLSNSGKVTVDYLRKNLLINSK